jgi:hypothetical protein
MNVCDVVFVGSERQGSAQKEEDTGGEQACVRGEDVCYTTLYAGSLRSRVCEPHPGYGYPGESEYLFGTKGW